jgi:acetyltransferase-like isoleucine patch superfamily enzyme
MDIAKTAVVHWKARLDRGINPKGIHIGEYSRITRNAIVLAHDHCRKLKTDTYIGNYTVVGINSIVLPGVRIGDHVFIGAGSVVTKDIPSNCIAAGNPAKVIKEGITINEKGQFVT